jgi:hypothetical protein
VNAGVQKTMANGEREQRALMTNALALDQRGFLH